MADESMIPLLPCTSLPETLDFYRALGFEVTHEQTSPYVYGAVRRGGIEIHLHRPKGQDSKKLAGTCLIFVGEVEPYHRAFADGLRARYGRVPTAGSPRITRLRRGQTRFATIDPSGNTLLYISRDEPEMDYGWYEVERSKLAHAIVNAAFLRDTYINDEAAARVLDKALARDEPAEPVERALALASRAELAVAMGDMDRAHELTGELRGISLSDEDRERHRGELQAADDLARWIHHPDSVGTEDVNPDVAASGEQG